MNDAFASDIIRAVVRFGTFLPNIDNADSRNVTSRDVDAAYGLTFTEDVTVEENYKGVMRATVCNEVSVAVDLDDGTSTRAVFYGSMGELLAKVCEWTSVDFTKDKFH